jgi:hypothetical protein
MGPELAQRVQKVEALLKIVKNIRLPPGDTLVFEMRCKGID